MKSIILKTVAVLTAVIATTSCMTTYDAYGRPVQSVDPAAATAGVVAAGVLGYAVANKNNDRHHHHHYNRGHYRPRHRGHYYR
jgi:Na+/glutamate symporter